MPSPDVLDLGEQLTGGAARRFVFVGGKGGVGKTTTAASLAVRLAKKGKRTLVVSTDPAHSLGDALGVKLKGEPVPVPLAGLPEARGSLHAMEIDPVAVVEDFRHSLYLDRVRDSLKEGRGLGSGVLTALSQAGVDINSLYNVLEMTPPGMDEAVALARLMQLLGESNQGEYERVVIDTAPTGHTLRLLSFPHFLHGLIASLLAMSDAVTSMSPFPRLFGSVIGEDFQQQLRVSKGKLEQFMGLMQALNSVFEDKEATSFVVVAIPTHLAVAESVRLLKALEQAHMPAHHIIINQCSFLGHFSLSGSEVDLEKAQAAIKQLAEEVRSQQGSGTALTVAEVEALEGTLERLSHQNREGRKYAQQLTEQAGPSVNVYLTPIIGEELTGVEALDRYAAVLKTRPSTE